MRKTIAVEDDLANVRNALVSRGYNVVTLEHPEWTEASAIVIKGTDRDFMDVKNISTKAPIIDASGLSAEDVVEAIEEKLSLQK